MFRFLLVLLVIGLTVFALTDAVSTPDKKIKSAPRIAWVLAILLLPPLGALAWLWVGKDRSPDSGDTPRGRTAPASPDDDPEFLASIDRAARNARRDAEKADSRKPGSEDATPGPIVDDPPDSPKTSDKADGSDDGSKHVGGADRDDPRNIA